MRIKNPTSEHSLVVQRANVGDLPSFSDLAVFKVNDDRLIHPDGLAAPWDAGKVVLQCPGDDDSCHFHVALSHNLLYFVV